MTRMKRVYEILFWCICVAAAALLLVLSLIGAAQLTRLSDEASRLEQEIYSLETGNRRLRADYESSLDLGEIERRAAEELGMQHVSPAQIARIPYLD